MCHTSAQHHGQSPADFEGPSEDSAFTPEEERLLASYPQPVDTTSLPSWRQPSSEAAPPLNISVCCHVIASRALAALYAAAPGACAADAFSLVEELMPLLAVPASERGSAAACMRLQVYFASLAQALEQQIQADSQQLVASGASGLLDETPVLGPAAAQMLMLIARFLAFLPVEACAGAVPAALALRLGHLCCNPALDVLLPGWRDAVRPFLPALAPACAQAVQLADEAFDALQRASALKEAAQVRTCALCLFCFFSDLHVVHVHLQ